MDATNGIPTGGLHFSPPVRRAGSVLLGVAGDIDMTSGDHFTRVLTSIIGGSDIHTVTLDIGHLHFIDSNGVTAIIRTHWTARQRGITLTVRNAGGPVREILEMLGVHDLLTATATPPPEIPGSP